MITDYEERCIRQYKSHTKHRANGDLMVRIDSGLWDIFYGKGFENTSRFRVFKVDKTPRLICVSGLHIPSDVREQPLKECLGHG